MIRTRGFPILSLSFVAITVALILVGCRSVQDMNTDVGTTPEPTKDVFSFATGSMPNSVIEIRLSDPLEKNFISMFFVTDIKQNLSDPSYFGGTRITWNSKGKEEIGPQGNWTNKSTGNIFEISKTDEEASTWSKSLSRLRSVRGRSRNLYGISLVMDKQITTWEELSKVQITGVVKDDFGKSGNIGIDSAWRFEVVHSQPLSFGSSKLEPMPTHTPLPMPTHTPLPTPTHTPLPTPTPVPTPIHTPTPNPLTTIPDHVLSWSQFGTGGGLSNALHSVGVDGLGNVYVADRRYHRIQKYDQNGTFLFQWGTSGKSEGDFFGSPLIAVDKSGTVYVADSQQRVQKFDQDGNFLLQWGTFGYGEGEFSTIRSIAVDESGNIYVLERGSSPGHARVQKFDSDGTFLLEFGDYGYDDGDFRSPKSIAVDGSGNIYVADPHPNEKRIQKFDQNGAFLLQWGSGDEGIFSSPDKIAVDQSGNVYVADISNDRIQKFDSNGIFLLEWGGPGTGEVEFGKISYVATDDVGNIYITDIEKGAVLKFDPSGTFLLSWNSHWGDESYYGPEVFYGYTPSDIAVDSDGNVYVPLPKNQRVQKFSSSGEFILEWGGWSSQASTGYPNGIAVDSAGDIYVFHGEEGKIKKYDPLGTLLFEFGSVGTGQGQFIGPVGIAIGNYGDIYVADESPNWLNNVSGIPQPKSGRIQKFDQTGTFLLEYINTTWGFHPINIAVDGSENVYVLGSCGGESIFPVFSYSKLDANLSNRTSLASSYYDTNAKLKPILKLEYGSGAGVGSCPYGMTVDNSGNIYITDTGNHRVQIHDTNGNFLAEWGGFGTDDGKFRSPKGIAVDGSGNIYVADTLNRRIQKFQYSE